MKTLAQRLVACPRFRWMPGMLTGTTLRVLHIGEDGWLHIANQDGCSEFAPETIAAFGVDLTDPATIGLLEHLTREAYKDDDLYCAPVDEERSWWGIFSANAPRGLGGKSRVEALVAALEAP